MKKHDKTFLINYINVLISFLIRIYILVFAIFYSIACVLLFFYIEYTSLCACVSPGLIF
jgi:hypothetical protein